MFFEFFEGLKIGILASRVLLIMCDHRLDTVINFLFDVFKDVLTVLIKCLKRVKNF